MKSHLTKAPILTTFPYLKLSLTIKTARVSFIGISDEQPKLFINTEPTELHQEIEKIENFLISESKFYWNQFFDALLLLATFDDFKNAFVINAESIDELDYYIYSDDFNHGNKETDFLSESDSSSQMNPRSGRSKRTVDYGEDFYTTENFQPADFSAEDMFNVTKEQFQQIDKNATFHFVFFAKKNELAEFVDENKIRDTIEKVDSAAKYNISVVELPVSDVNLKETLSRFGTNFPEIEINGGLSDKLEIMICKDPSAGIVTNRKCNDRVSLNIYVDDSVTELASLERAAFQIVKSYDSSDITLNFLASGNLVKLDSSEHVLENLYAARTKTRSANIKQCGEIIKAMNNALMTSSLFSDPDLITRPHYFMLTTKTGFDVLRRAPNIVQNQILE